jgi:sugar/nucleoside kinase (ribokinase family)
MKYDVLVYGPLFCDLVFTGLPGLPELSQELYADDLMLAPGGSAIVAVGLHRLGARVGLMADLGNDPFSRLLEELLEQTELDCSLIRKHPFPLPQLTVALSFPHDRAFVTRFERPKSPPDLANILREHPARHLHIGSFLAAFETPQVCQIAHAAGATVSFDPGWDEHALRDPRLLTVISKLDIFLPSCAELCHLAGLSDPAQAAQRVLATMRKGIIVMKDGAEGAVSFSSRENQCLRVPAIPVSPVDTTGAGDAFDAGFLSAFVQGHPLERCMQVGAVCGGLTATAKGGATATPTLQEVNQWLSKLPSSAGAAPTLPA